MYPSIMELPQYLQSEVLAELTDETFSTRTHGTRSCHNAGCRGPLCAKVNRDVSRDKYRAKNPVRRVRRTEPSEIDLSLNRIIYQVKNGLDQNAVA